MTLILYLEIIFVRKIHGAFFDEMPKNYYIGLRDVCKHKKIAADAKNIKSYSNILFYNL